MSVERKILELAKEIRQTNEYRELEAAKADVKDREAPRQMLNSWLEFQKKLSKKQEEGKEITAEEEAEIGKRFQLIMLNPYARALIEAQYKLTELLIRVQETLVENLGLVEKNDASDPEEADRDQDDNVVPLKKPKLWTPNS